MAHIAWVRARYPSGRYWGHSGDEWTSRLAHAGALNLTRTPGDAQVGGNMSCRLQRGDVR
jgi:hypothetical protein